MSMAELVRQSWSIPEFNGAPVSRDTLIQLLNIAVWAPNHHVREPWLFSWMETELTAADLAGAQGENNEQGSANDHSAIPAPGYLSVRMKVRNKPKEVVEDEAAIWCLIQNIRILARERGIGVVLQHPSIPQSPEHERLWQANAGEKVIAVLGMGHIDGAHTEMDSSNAAKIVRERRTVRQFKEIPVASEQVRKLLKQSVPEHGQVSSAWRAIEFGSDEERTRWTDLMMSFAKDMIAYKIMPGKIKDVLWKRTYNIPFNLVFALRHQPEHTNDYDESRQFGEVCSVMQNFQLLAWEQGLGMTWSSSEVIEDVAFRQGIGVNHDERIVGILHMGHLAKVPKGKERTSADKKMNWI